MGKSKKKRPIRTPKPTVEVFVEGGDEETYFRELKKSVLFRTIRLTIKPYNIKGGGYVEFTKYIKKNNATYGCVARFLVMDYDRYLMHDSERKAFQDLLEYCKTENKTHDIPYFMLVANPSLELFLCFHMEDFSLSADPVCFLCEKFQCQSLAQFKGKLIQDPKVFECIMQNSVPEAIERACSRMRARPKVICNQPVISGKGITVKIRNNNIIWNIDNHAHKNANMDEFFDIVGKFQMK